MGKTSKPLHIQVAEVLYNADPTKWATLAEQGHIIEVIEQCMEGPMPNILAAPYAMRLTSDMLAQLPSAFDLAIKGARALIYAPKAKEATAWKGKKDAKGTKARQRGHTKKQAEVVDTGEPTATPAGHGTGEPEQRSTDANNEGASEV